MGLIDSHTHLETFARRGDVPAVLQRARAAGLEALVTIGTDPDDWPVYRALAKEHAGFVHYTVGLHPCDVDERWERAVALIEGYWSGRAATPLAAAPRTESAPCPTQTSSEAGSGDPALQGDAAAPSDASASADLPWPVALGETGLDRFHLPKNDAAAAERLFAWQRAAFAGQLMLAKRLDCPVVVHSRGAFRECVEVVDASGIDWGRVVFHCFTEGPAEMAELIRRGGWGSFTGIITYKNAEAVRAAAKAQGLARLMVETDAPYLTPEPHRGKPNEPAFVRHTAEYCAALFGVGLDELAATTTATARRFYGL
jgi:TatD DNase family protein